MSLTVKVRDNETGDEQEVQVADNDYLLLCVGQCHEASVQVYPKSGTHVLTIKGCRPKKKLLVGGHPRQDVPTTALHD